MAAHELTRLYPENLVGATRTPWGWLAVCACGWDSGPLLLTKKAARRAYYRHAAQASTPLP